MSTITVNSQDLGNAGTIDTYGIYKGEGVDEQIIDDYNEEHNTDYSYDDFDWNYDHKQIVKDLAEYRAKALENDVGIIHSVKVLETGSPREYNFSTDWAMFEIDYDEDEVEKYVKDTKEKYDGWYRDSGWYSSTEWRDDDDPRRAENIRIAKLDYYLNTKALPEFDDWYWSVAEHESEIYINNTEVTLKKDNK